MYNIDTERVYLSGGQFSTFRLVGFPQVGRVLPASIPIPEFALGGFLPHPRPHQEKIPKLRALNRAIPLGIFT